MGDLLNGSGWSFNLKPNDEGIEFTRTIYGLDGVDSISIEKRLNGPWQISNLGDEKIAANTYGLIMRTLNEKGIDFPAPDAMLGICKENTELKNNVYVLEFLMPHINRGIHPERYCR